MEAIISFSEISSLTQYTQQVNDNYNFWEYNCTDYSINAWNLFDNYEDIPLEEMAIFSATAPNSLKNYLIDEYNVSSTTASIFWAEHYYYYNGSDLIEFGILEES